MQHRIGIGSVITTKTRITYRASKLQSIKAVHDKVFLYIKRYRRDYNLGSLRKIEPKRVKTVIRKAVFYKLLDVKWYHLNGLFRF
jgi:hypothetical protein